MTSDDIYRILAPSEYKARWGDDMTLDEALATAGKETEDKNKKKPYTSMYGNIYWLTDEEAEKRNNTAIMVLIGVVLLVIIILALWVIYDRR